MEKASQASSLAWWSFAFSVAVDWTMAPESVAVVRQSDLELHLTHRHPADPADPRPTPTGQISRRQAHSYGTLLQIALAAQPF